MNLTDHLIDAGIITKSGRVSQKAVRLLKSNSTVSDLLDQWNEKFPSNISHLQKLHNVRLNIKEPIICGNESCENITTWVDRANKPSPSRIKGYNRFCSLKCSANSNFVSDKIRTTCKEKYGSDYFFSSDEGKQKVVDGMIDKFGVTSPLKNKKLLEKQQETMIDKFGTLNYNYHLNEEFPHDDLMNVELLKKLNKTMHLGKIANHLSVNRTTVSRYFNKHNIKPKTHFISTEERELSEFIHTICDCPIITSDNKTIAPYQLDINIPDKNIAFEYCGLYWHSEAIEHKIDKKYHLRKTQMCEEVGIQLITIFEDEWLHSKELVKSKILSLLKTDNREKVYARKTNIKYNIDVDSAKNFMSKYHIQGYGGSSIRTGLVDDNDELVCLALFKKEKDGLMITRYASSKHVVGGFSKIISKYRNYDLFTFADRRWSNGNLYEKTGFKIEYITKPDYRYKVGTKRIHKFSFRKSILKKKLKNYDENVSEYVNCKNNGFYRIWDCGLIKYKLKAL